MSRVKQLIVPEFAIQLLYDDPVVWRMKFNGTIISFTGPRLQLGTVLPDDQEIGFVSPTTGLDARGNPVPLKGTVTITVSDPALLSIVQPDPLTPGEPTSGVIRPVGPLGKGQVVFTDTGDGSQPLTIIVEVEVTAGAVTTLNPPVLGTLRPLNTAAT